MPLPEDIARRHLARVVESSDDAIASKDLNGIITSWNRGAERRFGYTSAEAVGRSIRMIIPDDHQSEEDHLLEKIRAGEAVTAFRDGLPPEGRHADSHFPGRSPAIHDDSGRVVGASKIARDSSDRIQPPPPAILSPQ